MAVFVIVRMTVVVRMRMGMTMRMRMSMRVLFAMMRSGTVFMLVVVFVVMAMTV